MRPSFQATLVVFALFAAACEPDTSEPSGLDSGPDDASAMAPHNAAVRDASRDDDAATGDAGGRGDAAVDASDGSADSAVADGPDVTGRVLTDTGLPLAGVTIRIGDAMTVTDSEGAFTFAAVAPTYDAIVINDDGKTEQAVIYRALTRRDPVFRFTRPAGSEHTPTLSGTVDVPDAGTLIDSVELLFGSSEVWKVTRTFPNGSFSMIPSWSGAPSTAGTLHALRWDVKARRPSNYTGYGSMPLTLTDVNQQVAMPTSPVASGSLSGALVLPAGYGAGGRSFYAMLDDNTPHHIVSLASVSPLFENVVTPAPPGVLIQVWGEGLPPGGGTVRAIRHCEPSTANLQIDVPERPNLLTPPDQEVGVTTATEFTWSPLGGAAGVSVVHFHWGALGLVVVTTEPMTTLPEVPGFPCPQTRPSTGASAGTHPSRTPTSSQPPRLRWISPSSSVSCVSAATCRSALRPCSASRQHPEGALGAALLLCGRARVHFPAKDPHPSVIKP